MDSRPVRGLTLIEVALFTKDNYLTYCITCSSILETFQLTYM